MLVLALNHIWSHISRGRCIELGLPLLWPSKGGLESRETEKPFHIACKRDKMLERYVGGPALAKHVETQAWRAASPKIYSGGVQFWP